MIKNIQYWSLFISMLIQAYGHILNLFGPDVIGLSVVAVGIAYHSVTLFLMRKIHGDTPYLFFSPIPLRVDGVWTLFFYVIDHTTIMSKEELFRKRLMGEPVTHIEHFNHNLNKRMI